MQVNRSLSELLKSEIEKSNNNNFTDNWDHAMYGNTLPSKTLKGNLNVLAGKVLPSNIYNRFLLNYHLGAHLSGLSFLFDNLADEQSRELLVKILTYRVVGHTRHRLPLSDARYWENLKVAESLIADRSDSIDPRFLHFILYLHDLGPIGYPIRLYLTSYGVLLDFIIKQYVYEQGDISIRAQRGDVVLDAGGCWGDTALFFSNEVGPNGMVYSFEFIPSNIDTFKKNLELNPHLSPPVKIVPSPVWNTSGLKLYFEDNGAASRVSIDRFTDNSGAVSTLAIDDFVEAEGLEKVDFIKMDIEGAEPHAIRGAARTITKFKPKLAIAVYHNIADFYVIPEFLASLGVGYKFYLKHATIHAGETVLFASV